MEGKAVALPASMSNRLYTVGHSNHAIDTFIALLQQHGVTALGDVRSAPYSRYLPHFCQQPLQARLEKVGIRYVFLGRELGARPDDERCYVDGKATYERIAATAAFAQGLDRVVAGSQRFAIALMCAEKDPLTCHRAVLLCQHLKPLGLDIHHILSQGNLEPHADLEQRMLTLHGLAQGDPESADTSPTAQLTLFDAADYAVGSRPLADPRSPEEKLQEAYQRQGDRIAYVEHNHDFHP